MSVSGPCFVIMKDGVPFNKYEVTQTEQTTFTIKTDSFFFDNKDDAETYFLFLQQEEGEKELQKAILADRTFVYEKEELIAFRDSIDWDVLRKKAAQLSFIKQTTVVKRKAKK